MYLRKILNVLGVTFLASSSLVSAQGMINNCNKPGYVAITYDDGPNVYTSDLVQLLNDNDVKATFFVNGDNFLQLNDSEIGQNAVIAAYESGHQIGSHTWSHKNLDEIVNDDRLFNEEIVKLEQVLQRVIGVRPAYLRPPYGAAEKSETLEKLQSRGYTVIRWSTDTKDYATHDISQEMENIRSSFSRSDRDNGYIILSHDVYIQTTTELTRAMIAYIKEQGFKFCTVAECVGNAPYK